MNIIDTSVKRVRPVVTAVLVGCAMAVFLAACNSYVRGVDNPISSINDEQLNTEQQVPFLIKGVQAQCAVAHTALTLGGGLLSDEMEFGGPGATFPQYAEIDVGGIALGNPVVEDYIRALGQMRLYADLLVDRATTKITFADAALKERALFIGYFYGGLARSWWGAYFGLTETNGGGVIDAGPFIPTSQMYDLAIEKYERALEHTTDAYQKRVVNSLIARLHLYRGHYSEAGASAAKGMIDGDAPWLSLYAETETGSNDQWFYTAGRGRTQCIPAKRFSAYLAAAPDEAGRVLLETSLGDTSVQIQARYTSLNSPIPVITWQENALMLAEVALLGNTDVTTALGLVNAVRTSHSISPLAEILTRDKLIEERDKELCFTGNRNIDQLRFDIWHLPVGKWRFLPITKREREANPNF